MDRNPDDPSRPTNSGYTRYCLTDAVIDVLKTYGTAKFDGALDTFVQKFGQLERAYSKQSRPEEGQAGVADRGGRSAFARARTMPYRSQLLKSLGRDLPLALDCFTSATRHEKHVICATDELAELNIGITKHGKLPDIVLHDPAGRTGCFSSKRLLRHGPVNPKRHAEIEAMLWPVLLARVCYGIPKQG